MQVRTLLRLSVAVALATIVLKLGAWWLTGSVGLLSDALESFVNLAAALFALWMVDIAARPPDADHPYGHSKAEYFSSAFEGAAIAVASGAILWTALPRFFAPQPLEQLGWGLALTVLSSALNALLAWRMLAGARQHRSIALEADAHHLLTDVWTSVGVVIAVMLVPLTGWLWLDPLIAVVVALNILRAGARLAWRSVEGLMDSAVEPEVRARIEATLAQFAHATVRFDHLVTRRAGHRHFVDLHLHLPSAWSLARAAALRNDVERALLGAVPGLSATIQLLPMDVEPHADAPEERP
jgi:cation diffusion facilitator family transporter